MAKIISSPSILGLALVVLALGSSDALAQSSGSKNKLAKPRGEANPSVSQAHLSASSGRASTLIRRQTSRIMRELKNRPLRPLSIAKGKVVSVDATKSAWLKQIYDHGLVDASWATRMLSDKRLVYELLKAELGASVDGVYPKTWGLREFLESRRYVGSNGAILVSGDELEAALNEEFPTGFVVRPAVGVAPHETGKGLFSDSDQFIAAVLKPGNPYYSPSHVKPVKSHILNEVASGEAVVLQENIVNRADLKKRLKSRVFQEIRIHSYENRVIPGAVPERWVQTDESTPEQIAAAERFVADLLQRLPLALVSRQAFGIDVAVMDNGEMRIVDLITNRGGPLAWSSYLEQPRVIGAYSRHFEENCGIRFEGIQGALIRYNFANYLPYWQKRIEKARPGLNKVLAYVPPLPVSL